MKKTIFILSILAIITFALAVPAASSFAACDANATTICNPLTVNNLQDLIANIIKTLMLLLGISAVLMIVVSGFRMVMSAGNGEAVEKARSQLTWSVAGLAIAALAYSIVAIVSNLLASLGK